MKKQSKKYELTAGDQGFITLHRKLLQNPIMQNAGLFSLFIHLLLMACHKEERFLWNGQEIKLNRGQLLTGRFSLAQRTGINPNTIKDYLKILQNLKIITTQPTNRFSVITIIKYSQYQDKKERDTTQPTNTTPTRHQHDTTYNKVNKYNKDTRAATPPTEAPFNQKEYIGVLLKDKDPRMPVIGLYLQERGLALPNLESMRAEVRRNLRPAAELKGWSAKQILETIRYLENKGGDFEWTLETIGKYIAKVNSGVK